MLLSSSCPTFRVGRVTDSASVTEPALLSVRLIFSTNPPRLGQSDLLALLFAAGPLQLVMQGGERLRHCECHLIGGCRNGKTAFNVSSDQTKKIRTMLIGNTVRTLVGAIFGAGFADPVAIDHELEFIATGRELQADTPIAVSPLTIGVTSGFQSLKVTARNTCRAAGKSHMNVVGFTRDCSLDFDRTTSLFESRLLLDMAGTCLVAKPPRSVIFRRNRLAAEIGVATL